MVVESAVAAQGFPGYLDLADAHAPRWIRPNRRENAAVIRDEELPRSAYTAGEDNLVTAFEHLERSRGDVPPGSFVFVVSDFLVPPPRALWRVAGSFGWDVVPVLVQDPTWEQSFPAVSGFMLPLPRPVRLTRREAHERRSANEQRLAGLLETFAEVEIDPVVLSGADAVEVLDAFMRWHERRRRRLSLR